MNVVSPPHVLFAGGGFFAILVALFIIPGVLMWLWNMTIPEIFGLRSLEYWQAFRLIIIAGLLFGSVRFL